MLVALLLLPFLGGLAALGAGRRRPLVARGVAFGALLLTSALGLTLLAGGAADGPWLAEVDAPWSRGLGVRFHLVADGFALALASLSGGLGALGVLASWREIQTRLGLFHLAVCWTVAAAIGVFLAADLLLFITFWEAMLAPAFVLIALFGHGAAERSALKFLIYNQVGGIGLIAATMALVAGAETLTFDAYALAETPRSPAVQVALLLGFSLAFLVKLPVIPIHGWLPDAHTDAPTAGSILLAGVLLKTGAYGLYRFAPLLFPDAAAALAPAALGLGVAGALYGGLVACGQRDAKRLIAYTSIGHMGFVLAGTFSPSPLARAGAGVEMFAHAFSSSALFLMVGALRERTGTTDMRALGGLQARAPRLAAGFGFFAAAALAMPGTANFIGEALIIVGVFQDAPVAAVLLASALVLSVVYATRLLRSTVFGEGAGEAPLADAGRREMAGAAALAVLVLGFGLQPQILLDAIRPDASSAPVAPRAGPPPKGASTSTVAS
jgi:NADH-quinone oxidoreductase subunit M